MPNTKKGDGNSINDSDKNTLHDAGIDVAGMPSTSPENEIKEETIVDIDGGAPVPNDPDVEKTGIRFFDENKPSATKVNKEDLSTLAEAKMKAEGASDLEAAFRSELSGNESEDRTSAVIEKSGSLSALLSKIQEKLGMKKSKVKTELTNLKKMKEGISSDIADIKELEESEGKITAELKKIDTLKEEMDAIEKEVAEELKN